MIILGRLTAFGGSVGLFRRKDFWWISYTVDGTQRRESARTADEKLAAELLRKREAEAFLGKHFPTPTAKPSLTLSARRTRVPSESLQTLATFLLTLQRIGGWKTLEMLKRYNTIDDDDLREAVWKVTKRG